jgi:hypothetical protein
MLKNKLLVLLIVSGLNVFIFAQNPNCLVTCIDAQGMEKSLIIVGYTGTEKKVNIPSSIDGIPVRKIGTAAFKFKGLFEVIIPYGIISIGEQAFYGNQIASVSIPASVISIGNSAFDSNVLTTVVSKDGKVNVSANKSRTTTATQTLIFPSETRIYRVSSDKISGRTIIQYEEGYDPLIGADASHKPLSSVKPAKEAAYSAPITHQRIYAAPPANDYDNRQRQTIFNSIENSAGIIANSAYTGKGLTNVVIPEGTTHIGESAYASNNLSTVTIPNSVRVIGSQAFMGNNIVAITIGKGVLVQPDSFRYQFSDYYRMNNYKAGTYLLKTGHWNYEGQETQPKTISIK